MKLPELNIPLNFITPELQAEYNELMKSELLAKKVERVERIRGKQQYIENYLPEIKKGGKAVLDIGPGPGEFLELARYYGCAIVGVDNCSDPMIKGDTLRLYQRFCKLNHARQLLWVIHEDFNKIVERGFKSLSLPAFDIVNCQHAINLIFSGNFYGSIENGDSWIFDDTLAALFDSLFCFFADAVLPGGAVMIAALNAANKSEYSVKITHAAVSHGFRVEICDNELNHKFRRNV
jgi:SAM-dependent methyltransferase